jgi:hypothetical protein
MAYDPQKTRNRPVPAADRPAPVDAFLDAMSEVTVPPEGIDSEVTSGGDTAGEEIYIDTTLRAPSDVADWNKAPVVQPTDNGRSKMAIAIVAAVVALVAVLVVTRKRR